MYLTLIYSEIVGLFKKNCLFRLLDNYEIGTNFLLSILRFLMLLKVFFLLVISLFSLTAYN